MSSNEPWAARVAGTVDGFFAVLVGQGRLHGARSSDGVTWVTEPDFPSVSGLIAIDGLDVIADSQRVIIVGWGEAPSAGEGFLSFSMVGPGAAP